MLGLVPFDEKSLWVIGDNQGDVQICQIVSQMNKNKRKKNVRTLTDNEISLKCVCGFFLWNDYFCT